MSCCEYPGVGKEPEDLDKPVYETFNPGEVRLYGRPALARPKAKEDREKILAKVKAAEEGNDEYRSRGGIFPFPFPDELLDELLEYLIKEMGFLYDEVLNHLTLAIYDGNSFRTLPIEVSGLPKLCCADGEKYIKSIGVIYGYAFEGHCYKLPKPKIMFIPATARRIVGDKCGCDCGYSADLGYAVWQVDQLDRVVALDIRSGDVKTLILDENMPGNRSPQAYSQSLSMAPVRPRE
ncbi:hypothetical protein J2W42_003561 [Rhizobium tibeticum]|uniref:hypothetical protein n=1 Tax=Rhizobium tibeticum TaxID=501024 RepID=UPI0027877BE5|nr:hypothetical protein [Rhizobium tibeticum]MDP9810698.1 hypothetical protein [Rhizobium tibeticum]